MGPLLSAIGGKVNSQPLGDAVSARWPRPAGPEFQGRDGVDRNRANASRCQGIKRILPGDPGIIGDPNSAGGRANDPSFGIGRVQGDVVIRPPMLEGPMERAGRSFSGKGGREGWTGSGFAPDCPACPKNRAMANQRVLVAMLFGNVHDDLAGGFVAFFMAVARASICRH